MTGIIVDPNLMGKRFILHEIIGEVVVLGGLLNGTRDVMYCIIVNDPGNREHEEMYDLPGRSLIFDRPEPR